MANKHLINIKHSIGNTVCITRWVTMPRHVLGGRAPVVGYDDHERVVVHATTLERSCEVTEHLVRGGGHAVVDRKVRGVLGGRVRSVLVCVSVSISMYSSVSSSVYALYLGSRVRSVLVCVSVSISTYSSVSSSVYALYLGSRVLV